MQEPMNGATSGAVYVQTNAAPNEVALSTRPATPATAGSTIASARSRARYARASTGPAPRSCSRSQRWSGKESAPEPWTGRSRTRARARRAGPVPAAIGP